VLQKTLTSQSSDRAAVDPVTAEVLRNAFNSLAEEMAASLIRSAYSPIIYEARDCAVMVMDDRHRILGQSTGVPFFLGTMDTW
jgi:N-methylhydantoinase B